MANYDIVGDFIDPASLKSVEALAVAYEKAAIAAEKFIAATESKTNTFEKIQKQALQAERLAKLNADRLIAEEKLNAQIIANANAQKAADDKHLAALSLAAEKEAKIDMARATFAQNQAARDKKAKDDADKLAASKAKAGTVTGKDIQGSVDTAAQNFVLKQQAILASAYTTQLDKLYASQALNAREMQSHYNPAATEQNKLFVEAAAKASTLQKEIIKLETSTGMMGNKMKSAYGSTFSMTQIMREMPNFAISSRIGFMSLSNNLPMLMDDFKRLSQQIDNATGKAMGSIGAFKSMVASLFSLNTVLIVVSTLMIMFGDDIVKAMDKLFHGASIVDRFTRSQKALYNALTDSKGSAQSAIENIIKIGIEIKKYGQNSEDAKIIINEFNKTFNTHLTKIEEVRAAYPKMAKSFIESAIAMQAAMAQIDNAGDFLRRRQAEDLKLSFYKKEDVNEMQANIDYLFTKLRNNKKLLKLYGQDINEIWGEVSKGYMNGTLDFTVGILSDPNLGGEAKVQKVFNTIKLSVEKNGKDLLKTVMSRATADKLYQNYSASALELLPAPSTLTNKDKEKADKVVQTARDIFIAQEFYDQKRGIMVQAMTDLELRTTKEATDGTIISYKERQFAAEKYYEIAIRLAESDAKVETEKALQKFSRDNEKINSDLAANQKLLDNGKIFQKDFDKSLNEFYTAQSTIKANFDADFAQLDDKKNKAIESAALKSRKVLFDISQDRYKEEISILKISSDEKLRLIDLNYQKEKAKLTRKSTSDIGISAVTGFNKNTAFEELELQAKFEDDKYIQQISALDKEFALEETSGQRRMEIATKWDELSKARIANRQKYELEKEIELNKRKEELQGEIALKMVDTLDAIWTGFFKRQAQLVDDELAHQKEINSESLKDIDDREKAGLLTTKEASEERLRVKAFEEMQEKEAARRKKELAREQFLFEQAASLAKIWINFAMAVASLENFLAGGTLTPLYLGIALASSAMVAAQVIPQFEKGGVMQKDGKALVSEKRPELWVAPDGSMGITPNRPTVMDFKQGTIIYPDLNKIDLNSIIQAKFKNESTYDMYRIENAMNGIRKDLQGKRIARANNGKLFEQLDRADRYAKRRKGLF